MEENINIDGPNKNKTLWTWVIVVLIVVVGLVLWAMMGSNGSTVAPTPVADNTSPTALTPIPSEDLSTGSVDSGAPAATIAYSDALIKYAKARLQLDANCQADAQNQKMTFKNNALLMVDNRASVARTVHIGSVFPVKAYGFKIIKLSSAKLPATLLVDCDASQNVATILIEK
jgi:hypothetical protein